MKRLLLLLALIGRPAIASGQVVEYYKLDAGGNVLVVTDQSGAIIEQRDYLPFGEEWKPAPGDQPKRFTGKERDAETGLDYFGARYYASNIGRFTTADPAHTLTDNLVDPQRWNRYAYGRNNPFRFVDPRWKSTRLNSSHQIISYAVFCLKKKKQKEKMQYQEYNKN